MHRYKNSLRGLVFAVLLHSAVAHGQTEALLKASRDIRKVNLTESYALALKALSAAKREADSIGRAQAQFHLSSISILLHDFMQAGRWLDSAQALFARQRDREMLLKCLSNKGLIHKNNGEPAQAIHAYRQILTDPSIQSYPPIYCAALMNLGSTYRESGELDSAYVCYSRSMQQYELRHDEEGTLSSLMAISAIYNDLKDYRKAIASTQQYLRRKKNKSDISAANAYHNIGISFYSLNAYDSCVAYLNKALAICESCGDRAGVADAQFALANSYFEMDQPDQAMVHYRAALKYASLSSNSYHKAYSYYVLANIHYRNNQLAQAAGYADSSLKVLRSIRLYMLATDVLLLQSEISQLRGDFRQSSASLKEAIALRDSAYNENTRNLIINLDKKYELERKNATILNLVRENEIKQLRIQRKNWQLLTASIIGVLLLLSGFLFFRNRAANINHRALQLEQQLLHAQLNPHFIFNSLAGIQSYILNNKVKDAALYLADFGKLMRMVLEYSRIQYISLQDEALFLEKFLRLNQLLHQFRFTYKIDLPPEIGSVEIPSMLLQPFVENAIKHAFAPASTDNTIYIAFTRQNGLLRISVEDNGRGLLDTNPAQKTSLGNAITTERILNYKKQKKKQIRLTITNKSDTGHGSGTLVSLEIPVE